MKLISTTLFLFIITFTFAQHWTVTELSPMPEAISNNAVCEGFVNGVSYVYSFSGIDETKEFDGIHNRAYRYNTQTDTWESISPLPSDDGVIAASANRIGNIIYIIGGYTVFANGSEISSNKVHRYDTQTNTYLSDGAPIPIPIDDQVQVTYRDSLIYVITGWSNSGNINDVQIYDPANDTWQIGTPITFQEAPVFGGAGTVIGDTIYFFGGAGNGANFPIQSILRKGAINPDNALEIEWSKSNIAIQSYRPAATTAGNNAYLIGGAGKTYNFDGLAYNGGFGVEPSNRSVVYRPADGFVESDLSNELPMDLRGIANVSDSVKYLAGGMIANQTVTNKIWKLELIELPVSNKKVFIDQALVNVYPNPVSSFLKIEISKFSSLKIHEAKVQILNQLGQIVFQNSLPIIQEINIKKLNSGIYNLKISDGRNIISKTFVKF